MVPQIDAVIFDLDGTLADSVGDIAEAMNAVLTEMALPPHSWEAYKGFVGEGAEVLVQRAMEAAVGAGAPWPQPMPYLVERYRHHYGKIGHAHSKPYPGVLELLEALSRAGKQLAVLSNKRDDFTKQLVRQLFGKYEFVAVRGEQSGVPRKPHPQAALEIAQSFGVEPRRVAFVGDTAVDMKTAVAAGMWPVGVLWGFRPKDELAAAGAKLFLADAPSLLRHLRQH